MLFARRAGAFAAHPVPRPRWEAGGAEFVGDVGPWEASKLRLLNGSHLALACLGLLAGHDTVAQAIAEPLLRRYVLRLLVDEQRLTLPPSNHDIVAYAHQLVARWSNPGIVHRLSRVGRNASGKLPSRLLAGLRCHLAAGRPAPMTLLAVAAWMVCVSVARERGRLLLADSLLRQLIGVPVDTCRALLGAHCGAGLALERLFDTADRHLHAAVTAGRLRRKPGVTAVIEALERQRLPYGIATSSSRARAHHHLAASRLLGGMRVVVTRDDVQRGKPHPDLYLRAAGQLGVAPQRCLAFEDSYNGVRAAAAAGMPVVMVPDLLPATDEMQATALTVIGSLADLMPGLAERATPGAARR